MAICKFLQNELKISNLLHPKYSHVLYTSKLSGGKVKWENTKLFKM